MQPDDEVTKRYREIAREEPDAAMDAAILAASRRALRPSISRRWGAPVSIAAVLVLAFGLTLEMRHEEPGIESSVPARPAPVPEVPAGPPAAPSAAEPRPAVPAAKDSLSAVPQAVAPPAELKKERVRRDASPMNRDKVEKQAEEPTAGEREAPAAFPASPAPAAALPSPAPAPLPAAAQSAPAPAAPALQRAPMQDMNAAPAPAFAPRAKATAGAALRAAPARAESDSDAATRELERIAELRAAGRDAEADKALEDFRRDHPGYRIPEAMWERVKPR